MEKAVGIRFLILSISCFFALSWILLFDANRDEIKIETDDTTVIETKTTGVRKIRPHAERKGESEISDVSTVYDLAPMQGGLDDEILSVSEGLVAKGYFYDISEEIFDSPFTEEFLNEVKGLLAVKEVSISAVVEATARDEVELNWQPILDAINLDPGTSREAAAIITDALARKYELIHMWTNGDISQAKYSESEAQLMSISERLATVLDESEMRKFSEQRQLATQSYDYGENFYRISEEIEQGSLYPLILGDDQSTLSAYLAAGADANAKRVSEPDTSLLTKAISVRSDGAAILLIAHGADVNFANADGFTVLHQAAEMGNANLVAHLIDAGADPTAKSRMGLTPLMAARLAAVTPGKADFSDVFELLAK
ncbi:MAG: ankyrin repeat domain-containing protein [Gammaproteobacteria bacterium]|jgi:hypothetical protein|nr:ankyrin repeat domain-containing protein [Gammaproteobacteria bacterium]